MALTGEGHYGQVGLGWGGGCVIRCGGHRIGVCPVVRDEGGGGGRQGGE